MFAELYRKTRGARAAEPRARAARRRADGSSSRPPTAQLRASEERLQLVLSASRIRVWTLPLAEEVASGAPQAESCAGRAAALASFVAAVHPADRSLVQAEIAARARVRGALRGRVPRARGRARAVDDGPRDRDPRLGRPRAVDRRCRHGHHGAPPLRGGARSAAGPGAGGAARGRAGQPAEGRVPGDAVARAAHAAATRSAAGRTCSAASGLDPRAAGARGSRRISRNAELQTQLISEILDVSRIVTGKLRLEHVPGRAARRRRGGARHRAAGGRTRSASRSRPTLDAAASRRVAAIAARLQQVVWNVLSERHQVHAARAGASRCGWRRVGVGGDVTVRDDGPGIAARRSCRSSSTASARPTPRARGRTRGSGSGSRSCATSSSCTAAASRRRTARTAPAAVLRIVLPRSRDAACRRTRRRPRAGGAGRRAALDARCGACACWSSTTRPTGASWWPRCCARYGAEAAPRGSVRGGPRGRRRGAGPTWC